MVARALSLTATPCPTSTGVHSPRRTLVLAGPQAAQADLPEAWGLALVPSLSPKPLNQHIPQAAKQTPPPVAHPSFPIPARAITQVGPGRLVALWAWAHLCSAWTCIVLGIGGMACGGSGVRGDGC